MNGYYLVPINDKDVYINDYSLYDLFISYFPSISLLENKKLQLLNSNIENIKDELVNLIQVIFYKYEEELVPAHIMVKKDNDTFREVYSSNIINTNYDIAKNCQKINSDEATKFLMDNNYFKKIENYFNKVSIINDNTKLELDELIEMLLTNKPSIYLRNNENLLFNMIPSIKETKGFNQQSKYHDLDLYEHTLKVVDNTPKDIDLRLAALFHDLGKVQTLTVDNMGEGHFKNHWNVSKNIFNEFASDYELDDKFKNRVAKLIEYHDLDMTKESNLNILKDNFTKGELLMLLELKRADLIAQRQEYNNYGKIEDNINKLLKRG